MQKTKLTYVPWKLYTLVVTEAIASFTITSFLLGLYILHHNQFGNLILDILIGILYAVIFVITIWRMVRRFSLVAIMLMIPIAPLLMMGIIVSLIHLLQFFR